MKTNRKHKQQIHHLPEVRHARPKEAEGPYLFFTTVQLLPAASKPSRFLENNCRGYICPEERFSIGSTTMRNHPLREGNAHE